MTDTTPYDLEITRTFDAPPERVYRAFADPDEFHRWYGPTGFPVDPQTVEIDARVGGRHRFTMVSDADPSLPSRRPAISPPHPPASRLPPLASPP